VANFSLLEIVGREKGGKREKNTFYGGGEKGEGQRRRALFPTGLKTSNKGEGKGLVWRRRFPANQSLAGGEDAPNGS